MRAAVALMSVVCTMLVAETRAHAEEHVEPRQACADAYVAGQRLRLEHKLTLSRDKLLLCAQRSCPGFIQTECTKWLAEIENALPSIVVDVHDHAGTPVAVRTLRIDGENVENVPGHSVSVDPGEHTFEVETTTGLSATTRLLVREGERSRAIPIVVGTAPSPAKAPKEAIAPVPESSSKGLPAAAWIFGGIGVAGLATYAIFGIQGLTTQLDLKSSCSPYCSADELSSLRRKYLVADIGLAVGAAGALGFTIVLLTRPGGEKGDVSRLDLGVHSDGSGIRMAASSRF